MSPTRILEIVTSFFVYVTNSLVVVFGIHEKMLLQQHCFVHAMTVSLIVICYKRTSVFQNLFYLSNLMFRWIPQLSTLFMKKVLEQINWKLDLLCFTIETCACRKYEVENTYLKYCALHSIASAMRFPCPSSWKAPPQRKTHNLKQEMCRPIESCSTHTQL